MSVRCGGVLDCALPSSAGLPIPTPRIYIVSRYSSCISILFDHFHQSCLVCVPRSTKPSFQSPTPGQPTSRVQLEPLSLPAASQDSDQTMEDPFVAPFGNPIAPQAFNWSDEDQYYTRLNKIQDLLRSLNEELDKARSEDCLNSIIEDEETEGYLVKIAGLLPSYTTNSHCHTSPP
jgi:hypothetical protein